MTNSIRPPQTSGETIPPYAVGAQLYRNAGWLGVLPVDLNGAGVVPEGFTGGKGSWPDDPQIAQWVGSHGGANIGLRLPDDVIGIDVDCYDGKSGCRTLANLEDDFGPLPPTWRSTSRLEDDFGPLPPTWRSTSRQDGSAIYLFRVPAGRSWISGDQDIEIIRHRHRWMRVPPSHSPKTGELYRWYAPDGTVSTRPPRPDELPMLPQAWVGALAKNGKRTSSAIGSTSPVDQDHESLDFDDWLRSGSNVPGNQRDHLLRGIGWMRNRFYTRDSAIVLAWMVASRFETRRSGDPWTKQHIIALVDDVWNRYPAGERPEPWQVAMAQAIGKSGEQPQHVERSRLVSAGDFALDEPAAIPAIWGDGDRVLWAEGEGLMIAGPQGTGKTTLGQQLVLRRVGVREGKLLDLSVATTGGDVLYLALDRPRQAARSLRRMLAAADRETVNLRVKIWRGPLPVNPLSRPRADRRPDLGKCTCVTDD